MLSPNEIRQRCIRKYPQFLRSLITGEKFFPLDIRFGRPRASDDYSKLDKEIGVLAHASLGFQIEWKTVKMKRWGLQRLPVRIYFSTKEHFVKAIGKKAECDRFIENAERVISKFPQLRDWVCNNALKVCTYDDAWPGLLLVCAYFCSNPKPGLYARQLPIAVPTKFIESHKEVLNSLLSILISEHANAAAVSFEERWNLKIDEPEIRFRFLDDTLQAQTRFPAREAVVKLSIFSRLGLHSIACIIVENKKSFTTLPDSPATLAILGMGRAATVLKNVPWLSSCRLSYWGDMDDIGYAILSDLRQNFPNIQSLMMNWSTWEKYKEFAVSGYVRQNPFIPRLTDSEKNVWKTIRRDGLLLEQERIPHCEVERAMRALAM